MGDQFLFPKWWVSVGDKIFLLKKTQKQLKLVKYERCIIINCIKLVTVLTDSVQWRRKQFGLGVLKKNAREKKFGFTTPKI